MPSFHEIRFPARLSFGAMGGPERLTEIVTLANGHEERNTPWEHSRRRYDAGLGMRSLDDIAEAVAFFEARRGRLYGFRWKDWGDFRSSRPSEEPHFSDQPIGTGDGARTTFQLVKFYRSGGHRYKRPIRKPVAGSVRVALAGGERVEGTDFEVDTVEGTVTFDTPPDVAVAVSAGFEFDVPVRFDTDSIRISIDSFEAGEIPDVPVLELRT